MVKIYKKGGFYYCYNDDSSIISYLCNYKIINNRYNNILIKAKSNIDINNRINNIIFNLKKLDNNKLNSILEYIERVIYE